MSFTKRDLANGQVKQSVVNTIPTVAYDWLACTPLVHTPCIMSDVIAKWEVVSRDVIEVTVTALLYFSTHCLASASVRASFRAAS